MMFMFWVFAACTIVGMPFNEAFGIFCTVMMVMDAVGLVLAFSIMDWIESWRATKEK